MISANQLTARLLWALAILGLLFLFIKDARAIQQRELTFQWADPNEAGMVTEFILYFGQIAGGPYDTGSVLIPRADCTEIGGELQNVVTSQEIVLQPGVLYHLYFVMTARNAVGEESEFSNETDAIIDLREIQSPQNLTVTVRIVVQ